MIYFTADQHFGHENILRHCNRPFANANEIDAALIANWNATVTQNDDIYILGDFTMRSAEDAHKYLTRLNGRKYFIRGNHDKFLRGRGNAQYTNDYIWVKDYEMLHAEWNCFVLFHYPILEWANYYRGSIHLYGHVHNSETSAELLKGLKGLAFNVGVDVNGYCPVSIKTILNRAAKLKVTE